jgi:DivIVA domain-containing protein
MALTPEDVVNKRFQPTKFREGYDQDEVDDFLDEVVVELRRLNQENDELKQRLVASESRIAELQRSGAQAAQAAPAAPEQPATVAAPVVAAAAPAAAAYAAPTAVDANAVDPSSTNNLLQLARRLHEEHVREGVEKRDALIAEGHATAARVVAEAEAKQRQQMGILDQERLALEKRVDELRVFERDYRAKLKSYIEGQLRDLEGSATTTASTPAAAPSAPSAPTATVTSSQVYPGVPAAPQGYPTQDASASQEQPVVQQYSVPDFSAPQDYPAPSSQPQSFPGFGQG